MKPHSVTPLLAEHRCSRLGNSPWIFETLRLQIWVRTQIILRDFMVLFSSSRQMPLYSRRLDCGRLLLRSTPCDLIILRFHAV